MVNPKNLGVPIRVNAGASLWGPEHNVGVSAGVDRITVTADVVCRIIDRKLTGRKYGVIDDSDRVSFFICKEMGVIAVKTFVKDSAEKVDPEFIDKVLKAR